MAKSGDNLPWRPARQLLRGRCDPRTYIIVAAAIVGVSAPASVGYELHGRFPSDANHGKSLLQFNGIFAGWCPSHCNRFLLLILINNKNTDKRKNFANIVYFRLRRNSVLTTKTKD